MTTKKAAKKTASKSPTKKAAPKKAPAKKTPTKKAPAKKSAPQAQGAKKPSKSPAKKSSGRKYSPEASKSVEREMKAMHEGKLTIGNSRKKVTNPKQAIAIGLSEARRSGAKVPPPPKK